MSLHVHMHIHNMSASQNQGTSLPIDVWFPVISPVCIHQGRMLVFRDLFVREEGAGAFG